MKKERGHWKYKRSLPKDENGEGEVTNRERGRGGRKGGNLRYLIHC